MKKTIVWLLAVIMMLSLFAGCATKTEKPKDTKQDTQNETAATTTQDAEETTDTAGSIYIGISCPITGDSAEYGQQFTTAAKITADEINANGGINGKMLEFIVMDSKSDAKESCDIARVFVDNPDVVAVIGDFTSTCSMAGSPHLSGGWSNHDQPVCVPCRLCTHWRLYLRHHGNAG